MTGRGLRRGSWSVQELRRMRELLPNRGVEQTATLLRRSVEIVRRKAFEILRGPQRMGPWTTAEDQRLRSAWGALELPLLAPWLGREPTEVRMRAVEICRDLRSGAWTRPERLQLKRLYGSRRDEDLVVCLLRPAGEITRMAAELCLAKDKRLSVAEPTVARPSAPPSTRRRRMPRWTDAEVDRLRVLYPHHDNLRVAKELGRSATSVANKACQLGIRKSAAVLADIGRSNIACRYEGA